MDLLASSAKAALSGSIWPSHGVQRAGNSHVTHHVGHTRIITSNASPLLRFTGGKISSDVNQVNVIRTKSKDKMTPKISFTETNTGKSEIMNTVSGLIPFGASLFNFGQFSNKMGLADNRTAGLSIPVLGEMFGGNGIATKERQTACNNVYSHTMNTNTIPSPEACVKKFPNWLDAPSRQHLAQVVNSLNYSALENNCSRTRDMDSPWNKFYSQWKMKEGKSFPSAADSTTTPAMDSFCDKEKKGLKRVLEDAFQSQAPNCELSNRLQTLSLNNHIETEKSGTSIVENIIKVDLRGEGVTGINTVNIGKQIKGQNTVTDAALQNSNSSKLVSKANLSVRISENPHCNIDNDLSLNECINYSIHCDKAKKNAQNIEVQVRESDRVTSIKSSELSAGSLMLRKERCQKPKRSRPSSKKRRRQKSRQHSTYNQILSQESSLSQSAHQQVKNKCKFEKTDSRGEEKAKNCSDKDSACGATKEDCGKADTVFPMSFILGVNEFGSGDSGLYQFSVLLDSEESAFSEEDNDDCDNNFDISYRCDVLPCNGDLFNPLNFAMSISVSPSTPDSSPKSPFQSVSSRLDIINASWRVYCDNSKHKSKTSKKVSFADKDELASVHRIIAWDYAYRRARKGPWEEYARDRQRFQRRIDEAECSLSAIFKPDHRSMAYQRMSQTPVTQ